MYYEIETKVIDGKVQTVYVFNLPNYWTNETKQQYLLNQGFSERTAYMVACGVSEKEMQRIEND